MATTFLATLLLPVAAAVGIGAALSILLQANRESQDLRIVRLVPLAEGRYREEPAPKRLDDGTVTVLDVYGSLFYAGARSLEAALPEPADAHDAVVVLRLRGRASLGATAFTVLAHYADRLGESGGRLYVSGVDPELAEKFEHVIDVRLHERIAVYPARAQPAAAPRASNRSRWSRMVVVFSTAHSTSASTGGRRVAPRSVSA